MTKLFLNTFKANLEAIKYDILNNRHISDKSSKYKIYKYFFKELIAKNINLQDKSAINQFIEQKLLEIYEVFNPKSAQRDDKTVLFNKINEDIKKFLLKKTDKFYKRFCNNNNQPFFYMQQLEKTPKNFNLIR